LKLMNGITIVELQLRQHLSVEDFAKQVLN
jgi:hypothetical protein